MIYTIRYGARYAVRYLLSRLSEHTDEEGCQIAGPVYITLSNC